MSLEEITKIIFDHVGEEYEVDDDPDYTTDVNLFDFGVLDSLSAMELVVWIEKRFDIEITQKDIVLYPMNSVDEIAEVVHGKVE
ncbi:MAG: acyl carrier protein [Lachnospiraceae bacterium]